MAEIKIKDYIDLEFLKQYGFTDSEDKQNLIYTDKISGEILGISKSDKKIYIIAENNLYKADYTLSILLDLINAGFVRQV